MSSSLVNSSDIQLLQDTLSDGLIAILGTSIISPVVEDALKLYLAKNLQSIRFNMLTDRLAIGDLWQAIRENEAVVDMILDLTTLIRFHTSFSEKDSWETLCGNVADAIAVFNHPKVKNIDCAIEDSGELERFTKLQTAQTFLMSNPWLVTLFLLKHNEVVRKLCSQLAERQVAQRRTPKQDD